MSERLFAYGTLRHAEVVRTVTGRRFRAEDATLDGYACYTVRGHAYPGVVESPGARTPGALYAGVDPGSLARLDEFEGALYERRRLAVSRADGSAVPAWVFVVPLERRAALSAEPWDASALAATDWRRLLG